MEYLCVLQERVIRPRDRKPPFLIFAQSGYTIIVEIDRRHSAEASHLQPEVKAIGAGEQ
jgi:hypothetical protein